MIHRIRQFQQIAWTGCLVLLFFLLVVSCGNSRSVSSSKRVVVYVSEDQVFSEPILKDFERATGIQVKAVYDTEETKGTGVMNRLIAEKNNPRADVYWANEPIRAEILKLKGVSAPYVSPGAKGIPKVFKDPDGYWTGFSARARVLLVRRDLQPKPTSILAYAKPQWKGKGVIANPLFGTTTTHVAALFTLWGETRTKAFLKAMQDNAIRFSTSNGESADLVASGEFDFSLVDSDDAVNRIRQGKAVGVIYPDQSRGGIGCLILPNAVVLIKGASHPVAAKHLIDYLLSRETERKLAKAACAQIPLHEGVTPPPEIKPIGQIRVMRVSYARVARKLQEIQPFLKRWTGY
jgi:iron(III) transport system substrate-binding protein